MAHGMVQEDRQSLKFQVAPALYSRAPDIGRKEIQLEAALHQHASGGPGTGEQPDSLYETTVPGSAHVVRDKVPVQHHVTIHDDHIVPACGCDGPIARAREPES